jgi:hypothetical protein
VLPAAVRLLLGFVTLSLLPAPSVRASFPLSATLNPTDTAQVTWAGTATGPAAPTTTATSCREGLDCDTFILTLGGTAADWAGRLARIEINWQFITRST